MKKIIISIISFFTKIYLKLYNSNINLLSTKLFLVKIKYDKFNHFDFESAFLSKLNIVCTGKGNVVYAKNSYISDCEIVITGSNNKLTLKDDVKLRGSKIIIRGSNCEVVIGDRTTFGGIRIVNVGLNNMISIGKDCLFADNIELWASDTHPIYNSQDIQINKDKPIRIGNNVWVGSRVIILKGVSIEDGSIIGMGSVVTKDIPKNVVSVGFPNRTIKELIYWKLHY